MVLKLLPSSGAGGGVRKDIKDLYIPSATAFQEVRRSTGVDSPVSASGRSSFGSSSANTSSREDSDSDCTCDIESSSNLEDSGLFSYEGETDSIIAPPSPFVTRSILKEARSRRRYQPPHDDHSTLQKCSPGDLHSLVPSPAKHGNNAHGRRYGPAQADSSVAESAAAAGDNNSGIRDTAKPLHSTTIYVNGASVRSEQWDSGTPEDNLKKTKKVENKNQTEQKKNGTITKRWTDCQEMRGDSVLQSKNEANVQEEETLKQEAARNRSPISYPSVPPPLCKSCVRKEVPIFDPSCSTCWSFFQREDASPSHVFAVLRIWMPHVQRRIARLVKTALDLGCGVLDRDAVTDMTLLHYAVKSGSTGIGDPATALQVVRQLLEMGADLRQRCKWTCMTALHYAAYFDVPSVLDVILRCPDGVSIDDPCLEYSNGTPLHIAAANLSEGAVRVLLFYGASRCCKDNQGRTPSECVPSCEQYELVPDLQELIFRLQRLLHTDSRSDHAIATLNPAEGSSKGVWGKAILKAIGLKLGDRVLISGVKTGILRYAGPTEFATGLWAGVEMEIPEGRHNGTVKGVVYFRCAKNYGIFVPVNRLTKIPNVNGPPVSGRERRRTRIIPEVTQQTQTTPRGRRSLSLPPGRVNHGKVDLSKISSRVAQDIRNSERKLTPGDRVCVDIGLDSIGSRTASGTVQFTGPVHFASGYWIGVELDDAKGSHDGSVCGTRYFSCQRQHGIFAAPSRVNKIKEAYDKPSANEFLQHRRSTSTTRRHQSPPPLQSYSLKMSTSLTDSFSSTSSSSSSPAMFGEESFVPLALPGLGYSMQTLKTSFFPTNTSMTNLNKCFSGRYISSRQRQEELERQKEEKENEPHWEEPPPIPDVVTNRRPRDDDPHWLQVGHSVFYRNNVGIIRYIGLVHFAEGNWLGVELRDKRGRNNGVVKGKRYFTCKSGHGVMVPPNKVTVHGLKGDRLVRQDDDPKTNAYEAFSML